MLWGVKPVRKTTMEYHLKTCIYVKVSAIWNSENSILRSVKNMDLEHYVLIKTIIWLTSKKFQIA